VALVWLVLVLLVAVPPASAAPVQLLPASGTAGSHATLVASELPPQSEVELRVGNGSVKRLRANSAGVVTTRELIPRRARGRVPVSVKDARGDAALLHYDVRSRWAQAASFASADWRGRVADIAANLSRGRLVVAVDVRGLLPEERVSARFGGRRVARAIAGPRGRATLHAVLPQEATGRQLVVKGRRLRLASTLPTPPATAVVAADIACKAPYETYEDRCEHAEVAELADSLNPDVIVLPGDVTQGNGTLSEFRRSFDLSWGQLEIPLRPTPGNHEYRVPGAAGYFDYFEMQSGGWRPPPWYAFNVGDWRFFALNSNCEEGRVDCGPDSEQEQWLRANLEAEPSRCTVAFWHHPRYSSGFHGSDPRTASIWRTLDQAGAELVLTGHDHHYERFALQDENGQPSDGGMREFVVGTGGNAMSVVREPRAPHTRYAQNREFGVLRLGLYGDVYTWRFIGLNGKTMDRGVGGCFD
jgi:hypothetical protein